MLRVFICDDDPRQRELIETTIKKHICIENLEIGIALTADNPNMLLDYLDKHPNDPKLNDCGLYFLDVDLNDEMNGIQLAAKIREREVFAHIVFITTHAELSYLTFRYKIGALDYIIKDRQQEVSHHIKECVDTAYKYYLSASITSHNTSKGNFPLRLGDTIEMIPLDEIMFFEAHTIMSRKLILHMRNRQIEFPGNLKKIAEALPDFYFCHKSYLVNMDNIKHADIRQGIVEMVNGEKVLISKRKAKEFIIRLEERESK